MPTGYTAGIKPEGGVTFPEFVMNCARAFGACLELRDEPMGGDKIPEKFEPSDFYDRMRKNSVERLKKLESMTWEEITREASKAHNARLSELIRRIDEMDRQRTCYEKMLEQVVRWKVPTPEHEGLKSFMIQQIKDSIDCDCSARHMTIPNEIPAALWHAEQIQHERDSIARNEIEHAKEVQRAAERTKWVADLRASLRTIQ